MFHNLLGREVTNHNPSAEKTMNHHQWDIKPTQRMSNDQEMMIYPPRPKELPLALSTEHILKSGEVIHELALIS